MGLVIPMRWKVDVWKPGPIERFRRWLQVKPEVVRFRAECPALKIVIEGELEGGGIEETWGFMRTLINQIEDDAEERGL